ncbi:hypothetical protein PFLUV_G00122350 [Perca fluviatilis]|uniref:Cadherin domain-containing protein n=2 Tax=Perca fluviatilis TaxID=8168 RepID=A0A6A5F318_PERFL|nr:uncharacterized protein LOC120567397 isoform X1 [Perca fluviatilis]KAF1384645.1 hypothetical protein PFLUV_G00122350 [Perca fluviatilis]
MLLLFVTTVSCVVFGGSSAGFFEKSECYGKFLRFPFTYTPPRFNGQLYFTPKNGGSRKLVMDKDEAKDSRLQISIGSVVLTDLTERDEGTFSVSINDAMPYDIIKLEILDCAYHEYRTYGSPYSSVVPTQTEYIEFLPFYSEELPRVLWNRTDPQANKGSRLQMKDSIWEIKSLNQADGGYYNFRKKDKTVLSRLRIVVGVNDRRYYTKVNERFVIENPSLDATWTVTFTPAGEVEKNTLMEAGNLVTDDRRIRIMRNGIEIDPVNIIDSGTFEFRDQQGYLAKIVELRVEDELLPSVLHPYAYIAIIGGIIFAVVVCCCCVKKCCCKNSSSKRHESAPETEAAPAVYYHDLIQPAGPSYSVAPVPDNSYQPMNSLVSGEHTTTSLEPSVEPLGGQGGDPAPTLGFDCLSSDPVPKFELKGLSIPSALPLVSDSTFCDVYTSDKLNFL